MAAQMSAMQLVDQFRQRNLSPRQEIDQEAVAQFVAGADGASREALLKVIERGRSLIERGERSRGPNGYVSLETMAVAIDCLQLQIDMEDGFARMGFDLHEIEAASKDINA